jgi:hypothetical protein
MKLVWCYVVVVAATVAAIDKNLSTNGTAVLTQRQRLCKLPKVKKASKTLSREMETALIVTIQIVKSATTDSTQQILTQHLSLVILFFSLFI